MDKLLVYSEHKVDNFVGSVNHSTLGYSKFDADVF